MLELEVVKQGQAEQRTCGMAGPTHPRAPSPHDRPARLRKPRISEMSGVSGRKAPGALGESLRPRPQEKKQLVVAVHEEPYNIVEILDAASGERKIITDRMSITLKEQEIIINDRGCGVAVETSPVRRVVLRACFYPRDQFTARNPPGGWQVCSPGLEIRDDSQSRRLFWFAKEKYTLQRNRTAAREAGLQDPNGDAEGTHEDSQDKHNEESKPDIQRVETRGRPPAQEAPAPNMARTLKQTTSAPPCPQARTPQQRVQRRRKSISAATPRVWSMPRWTRRNSSCRRCSSTCSHSSRPLEGQGEAPPALDRASGGCGPAAASSARAGPSIELAHHGLHTKSPTATTTTTPVGTS